MPKRESKTSTTFKFQVDDKVRVNPMVMHAEYLDIPLGGWAGHIVKTHDDGTYTVRWNAETLTLIPLIYKKRCERDGVYLEQYRIATDALVPDDGGHPTME